MVSWNILMNFILKSIFSKAPVEDVYENPAELLSTSVNVLLKILAHIPFGVI